MNDVVQLAMRLAARKAGRAQLVATTSSLSPDRGESFAYAPICVVAEQRLQAIAFGNPLDEPQLTREALPLGRETAFLEPFSDALDEYLRRAAEGRYARIFLLHKNALETLVLMSERYERNPNASEKVRRLGTLGRILFELSQFPGQQIVVNLAELLSRHIVSGASATKDAQIRYLLTWLSPPPTGDVAEAAEVAALRPAAAMLKQDDDHRVERLRAEFKRAGMPAALRSRIDAILDRNAVNEWQALVEAKTAFTDLALPSPGALQAIYDRNLDWLQRNLRDGHASPSRTFAMAALLDDHVLALFDERAAMLEEDRAAFEEARQAGRAFVAEVASVTRLGLGRAKKPVHMRVTIRQPIARLRRGTAVRFIGSKMVATVLKVARPVPGGPYDVELDITTDVNRALTIPPGTALRMLDGQRVDIGIWRSKVFARARDIGRAVLVADALPEPLGRIDPSTDLTKVLSNLERP
jgi:hypothetical protein